MMKSRTWRVVLTLGLLSSSLPATTLFINGDFTSGNTGFGSGYAFVAATPSACNPQGVYTIALSPNACHNAWPSAYPPAPGASPEIMIVNGATVTGVSVWSQTVAVLPDTTYYFSFWVASNYDNPAILSMSINGIQIGNNITADTTLGTWHQFFAPWNSGAATIAAASVGNQNTVASGNDFSLDLFAFDTVAPDGATSTVPEPSSSALLLAGLVVLYRKTRQ